MPVAVNEGTAVHYEIRGSGAPVLLIPGLGLSGAAWDAVAEGLLTAGHQVITVDPRGAGASDVPDAPYTAGAMVGDAVAVLDAAGVEAAHVVGLSMGGMIAQELALRCPSRVRRVVLLSTYATPDVWSRKAYEVRRNMIAQMGLAAHFELSTLMLFGPDAYAHRRDLVERAAALFGAAPPTVTGYTRQLEFMLAHDAYGRLGELAAPVLVVSGDADLICPVHQGIALAAAIPNARLSIHRGASHALWLESPERFTTETTSFFTESKA